MTNLFEVILLIAIFSFGILFFGILLNPFVILFIYIWLNEL